MWDRYRRDLQRALRTSTGREIGLLFANYEAEREFGTTSLTKSTLQESVKAIRTPGDVQQFRAALEAQERLSVYLSNLERRYLWLRERIANLRWVFLLFKQYEFDEWFLNVISWDMGKSRTALRQRMVSHSYCMLFADITLDEGGKYVRVRLSDKAREMAFKTIEVIQDQALQIKTRIEVACGFMDERALNLPVYESFLDRIEGELRESIRSVQGTLYREEDPDSRREMRVILPEPDDDFLRLIEALPDYDGLEIDEDAYRTEEGILLHDKD